VLIGAAMPLTALLGPRLARPALFFTLAGASAAGLALVKLNVGAFALIALLWSMLAVSGNNRSAAAARRVLALASLCLPAALMRERLGNGGLSSTAC